MLLHLALLATLVQQEPKGTGTIVLRAARVIDGTGAAPIQNGVVVVTDDKIVFVGSQATVRPPAGARVMDLGDVTLLPGFVDAHTHIIGRTLGDPAGDDALVRDYASFGAILGVANAQKTLMGGFTSIRNVGAGNFDDMALRKAVNDGFVPGPRMQNAGHGLGITGGHCDENGFRPGLADGDIKTGVADGPDQVRAAVRYQAKYGADVIKTCATGGVLSEGDAVGVPQYTYDELKAMVDEATKLERKVAAHAHGTEGIKIAVRAGVASIEHGSFLDVEGAKLMAQRGTYLVPTLSAGEAVLKAVDAGVGAHGANGHEFTLMVEWGGMTPMQSIVAGTMSGAKLLGWDNRIGSLTAGKLADVVAVPGNPLQDIKVMERPVFVMKNGVVYKSSLAIVVP